MPRYTSLADFEDTATPNTAERDLIAKCKAGEQCILGSTVPTGPSDTRTIRADLLRLLITGGSKNCGLPGDGIWLEGAWITGELNLRFAKARGRTVLDACHFTDQPDLTQSSLQQLSHEGSHLPGLFAQGMKVKGDVFLRNLRATGTVVVAGAQIGGQLACEGAELDGKGGRALHAQGVTTGQGLFLSNLRAMGTVDVNNAQIGGQLSCTEAKLDGKGGMALHAQGVTTGKDLFLSNMRATGTVVVNGAQIGGQFDCTGATFAGTLDEQLNLTAALRAQRLHVKQGFIWRNVTVTEGRVDLTAAHVGDLVDDLACWPKGEDQLDLDGFTYERIDSTAPTDARSRLQWLKNGAVFNGTLSPQPYTQLAKVLSGMGHDRDARKMRMAAQQHAAIHMRLLDRATRKFARALRHFSAVRNDAAIKVLQGRLKDSPGSISAQIKANLERFDLFHRPLPPNDNPRLHLPEITRAFAQQDFRNQMWTLATKARLRIGWSWFTDQFLRRVVGYGYAPERAILAMLVCILPAAHVYSQAYAAGIMVPNSDIILTSFNWWWSMGQAIDTPTLVWDDTHPARHYETFYGLAYAFDVFVPLVDIGQESTWSSTTVTWSGWGVRIGTMVLEVAGWVITALGAAAVTGIIKRDRG